MAEDVANFPGLVSWSASLDGFNGMISNTTNKTFLTLNGRRRRKVWQRSCGQVRGCGCDRILKLRAIYMVDADSESKLSPMHARK